MKTICLLGCGVLVLLMGCSGVPHADSAAGQATPDQPGKEPVPPSQAERPSVLWWALPEAADVGPDDRPPPANPVWPDVRTGQVIQLAGAPGEVLGFQLVLSSAVGPRRGVRLEASSLDGRETALPATAVALWRAEWVRVQSFAPWFALETGRPPQARRVADRLSPLALGQRFDLDGRQNQPLFVELALPAELPAGLYRGTLTLDSDDSGGQLITAEIHLRVWPFRLTGPTSPGSFPILAGVSLSRLLRRQADYAGPLPVSATRLADSRDLALLRGRAALSELLTMLRSHGLRPILEDLRPEVEWHWPGWAEVNWVGYDAVLGLCRVGRPDAPREPILAPLSADFPDPQIFAGPRSRDHASDSPRAVYQRALRDYARQVAEHFERIGRSGDTVVAYRPEPTELEPRRMLDWIGPVAESRPPLAVVMPVSPKWLAAQIGHARDAQTLTAAAAIWSSGADWFSATDGPTRAPIWLRTADSEPPFLASGRVECSPTGPLSWGWAAWRYRVDALDLGRVNPWPLHWTDEAGSEGEPLADRFSDAGVPSWVYPGSAAHSGRGPLRPSRRLKLLRRAIQDVQYLELAERVAGRERTESLARVLVSFALSEATVGADAGQPEGIFGGWSTDANQYEHVRRVMGAALASATPSDGREPLPLAELPSDWQRLSFRGERVELTITGLSVLQTAEAMPAEAAGQDRLVLQVRVVNRGASPREDLGRLSLLGLPSGWQAEPAALAVPRLEPGAAVELRLTARPLGGGAGVWNPEPDSAEPILLWDRLGRQHRQPLPIRRLLVRSVTRPPLIDGDLSDWVALPENTATGFVSLFRASESPAAGATAAGLMLPVPMARPTSVRLVADEQALYVAFQCGQLPTDDVGCRASNRLTRYRGSPWGEEAVELVLAPPAAAALPRRIFRISVKRTGVAELSVGDIGTLPSRLWSADVQVACSPIKDSGSPAWVAELRIPWAALGGRPIPNQRWGANFARHSRAIADTGAWSASLGHICRVESLGTLILP